MTSERSADAPEFAYDDQSAPPMASSEIVEAPQSKSASAKPNPFRAILSTASKDGPNSRYSTSFADNCELPQSPAKLQNRNHELPARAADPTMSLPSAGMKVRMLVALGAAAPSELIALLTNDGARQINIRLNGTSHTTVIELFRLAVSKDLGIRSKIAENRSTPGIVLAKLSRDRDWRVRSLVAINVNTPATVLKMLVQDLDEDVVLWAAGNPSLPKSLLTELALHHNDSIRKRVAANPSTSSKALYKLAYDANDEVRIAVSSNQHTPLTALSLLCFDRDYGVRRSVALNPSAHLQQLCALAVDSTWCVRVAANQVISTKFSDLKLIAHTHS